MQRAAVTGSLLGTAAGDALGLAYEGLSPRRAVRLFGQPDRYRLLPRRGMVSDDTEHACLVLQALIGSGGNEEKFIRLLARGLRLWFISLPAGIGMATAKASLKLLVGIPPHRSGVFSAGNGPCMRSPILGATIDDTDQLRRFVRASTRLTHTDPKAEYGAWIVALAARFARMHDRPDPREFATWVHAQLTESDAAEAVALVDATVASVMAGEQTTSFAQSRFGQRGVSGYIYQTLPVVLHAWLSHPRDLSEALRQTILCGGDADTTAAIVGGIVGAAVGREGIPAEWLETLTDWPRTVTWMEELVATLDATNLQTPIKPPRLPVYGVVPRNLFFLVVVLAHGFRRLLPPY